MPVLDKILSSGARAAVFTVLFGIDQREFHLRELQRKTGYAVETVRSELKLLEEMGLLIKRRDGNRLYFKADISHPLFNDIRNIVLKTRGLKDVLVEALNFEDVRYAFVFGSVARTEEKAESDIDLFIIGNTGLREISKRLKKPSEILAREINPHIMFESDFISKKNAGEHFITNILNSNLLMIIGSENELRELA